MRNRKSGTRQLQKLGRRLVVSCLVGVVVSIILQSGTRADEPRTAAIFEFELIDTSLEGAMRGAQPAEQARLILVSKRLRELLAQSGRYVPVDIVPAAAAIDAAGNLYGCNGCEADIAEQLGAELAVRGVVQKVSNLILNMTIYITEAGTGRHVAGASVDIRGNTDESWLRAVSYIVRNRLVADPN